MMNQAQNTMDIAFILFIQMQNIWIPTPQEPITRSILNGTQTL